MSEVRSCERAEARRASRFAPRGGRTARIARCLLTMGMLVGLNWAAGGTIMAATLSRPADPVVVKGSAVSGLTGIMPGDLVTFRWTGAWEAIPVQVDERDVIEFSKVYDGGFGGGVFAEQYTDAGTFTGPDGDPTLDGNDEIVFMARDAGDRPPSFSEPSGVVAGSGIEVRIDDPLDGGMGYVYLFESAGSLDPTAGQNYVSYAFNLLSGDYKTTYLLNGGPGTSHGPQANPEDSLITTPFYARHWSYRWTNDDLRIFAGSSTGADIIEKRDYWIDPGECGRHNATFNAGEGAFFANKDGPVRSIRSYMGANSGPLTQNEHLYYDRREDVITTARVHPRPATGIFYDDYGMGALGMTYVDSNNPAGVTIDGVPDAVATGPLLWDMVTGAQGSMVSVTRVDTDIPNYAAGVTSYYADELNTGIQICQECEEAPTLACPTVIIISDPHLIGAHGTWGQDPLPNTDPRNPPFNNLSATRVAYYGGPGMTAADADLRSAWVDNPMIVVPSAWNGSVVPVPGLSPAAWLVLAMLLALALLRRWAVRARLSGRHTTRKVIPVDLS